MKEQTIKRIEEEKIITIVRGVAREKLILLAQSMFDGGIRLIECTYEHAIIGTREENPVISGVSELVPFSF